jgi:hypothetical protein
VKACQRSIATSQYRASISIARHARRVVSAAIVVVPLPENGS